MAGYWCWYALLEFLDLDRDLDLDLGAICAALLTLAIMPNIWTTCSPVKAWLHMLCMFGWSGLGVGVLVGVFLTCDSGTFAGTFLVCESRASSSRALTRL